ncbi:hypothetical protein COA18_04385 [Priestia megaterium]|nr:hypothetical protein COA18_04385 [Priestia megaterium]
MVTKICLVILIIMSAEIVGRIKITKYTRRNVIAFIVITIIGTATMILSTIGLVFGFCSNLL